VLDVMLPDLDGFAVTKLIRKAGITVPVIFLTAKDESDDEIAGLTAGGDDYITKPFALDRLVARINAVLRRTSGNTTLRQAAAKAGNLPEIDPVMRVGDLELNDETHDVRRGGELIELTPTEYNLLEYLMINSGKVVSKSQILDNVWNHSWGGDTNIIESYISALRRKIDANRKPLIHTKRGVGYILRENP